ncbi:MAG: hypothetical protein RLZZ606_989, partial [Actinomycetota bacterium]
MPLANYRLWDSRWGFNNLPPKLENMSDLDLSQEIKQIRATFATIAEVTD